MSIKKHPQSGIWWVDITPPGGKRIRRSTGTRVKKEAQEFHDHLRSQLWRERNLGDKPKRFFEEACILFLRASEGQSDYKTKVRHVKYWNELFSGKHICSLTSEDILNGLPTHRTFKDRPALELSSSTRNRYLASIQRIMNLACSAGWIDKAPTLTKQKERTIRVRWLTFTQAKSLIKSLRLDWMRDLCEFALATGCRFNEITTLTWGAIDMHEKIAWIHSDLSKSDRARAIPLNEDALAVLERRKGMHAELAFTRVKDGIQILDLDYRDFHRAMKASGVSDFSFHDLRHTWASWHVQNGTPLFALKEMGGWETLEMVKKYAHMDASHLAHHANSVTFRSQQDQKTKKVA